MTIGPPKDIVAARIEALAGSLAPDAEKLTLSVDDILEHSVEENSCERLSETLSRLVSDCSSDWDSMLDSWLFSQRTSVQSSGRTPFSILFNRDPLGSFGSERSRNMESFEPEPSKARRTLKSSRLQCRHCDDVFTSRVSFKLHQKRHLEEAMRVGAMKGEKNSRTSDVASDGIGNELGHSDDENEDQLFVCPRKPKRWARKRPRTFDPRNRIAKLKGLPKAKRRYMNRGDDEADVDDPDELDEVAESTVSVMKELLEATKEARSKRGKYAKFSLELQDEIAAFAIRHGVAPTLRRFEHITLTEGSIRNFVRAHKRFPPSVKENIGKIAYQYGSERALEVFRKKRADIGDGLNAVAVRKFRRYFLNKNPSLADNDAPAASSSSASEEGRLAIFGEPLRDEIGHFAFQFGNVPAVEKFSARLQFPMQESTVRKFKRAWMARNNVAEIPRQNDQDGQDLIDKTVVGLIISDRDAADDGHGVEGTAHFGEQTDGNDQTQATNFNQIVIPAEYSSNMNHDQPQGVSTAPLSLTINATGEEQQPQQHHLINLSSAPETMETTQGPIPIVIQDESGGQTATTLTVTLSPTEEKADTKEAVFNSDDDEEFIEEVSSRGRPLKRKVLKSRKKSKRTKKVKMSVKEEEKSFSVSVRAPMQRRSEKARKRPYTTYDPELRAKIGQYAMAGHGNQETIDHFRELYGVELPESTVRF